MAFSIPNAPTAAFADQAEPDSVDFDIITLGSAWTGVVSGCAVTAQGTPDMTVAVASGTVKVAGTNATVTSGNLTIGTADATNARFDLIAVNNSGTKSVVAGTAAANPVFPAHPANSVVLAAVYVPANDTTIASNQIVDKRVFVRDPSINDLADVDTTGLGTNDGLIYNGTSWVPADVATLSNATPQADSGSGAAGTATEASRSDHVHPASAAGLRQAYTVGTPKTTGLSSATYRESGSGYNRANGQMVLTRVVFENNEPISQVGFYVGTAGTTNAVVKPVIYAESATLIRPDGAPLREGNQVAATTTGLKFTSSFGTNFTPTPGTAYWVGLIWQGSPTTGATVRAHESDIVLPEGNASGGYYRGYLYAGPFTGAAPTISAYPDGDEQSPQLFFKRA